MDTLELNKIYRYLGSTTIIITKKTKQFITFNQGSLFTIPKSEKFKHRWEIHNDRRKIYITDDEIYIKERISKRCFKSPNKFCFELFDESLIEEHLDDL